MLDAQLSAYVLGCEYAIGKAEDPKMALATKVLGVLTLSCALGLRKSCA